MAATSAATDPSTTPAASLSNSTGATLSIGSMMSNGANGATPISFGHLITIKLGQENHLLWKAQVVPLLKSLGLYGYVQGTLACLPETVAESDEDGAESRPNPTHHAWEKQDQAILSALLSSMTESVLDQFLFLGTFHAPWSAIEASYVSQSTARTLQIRRPLSQIKKRDSSITDYFNKIKALSDKLTSIGQPLTSIDFVAYVLAGLDSDYDSIVSSITVGGTVSEREIFSHMLNHEQRLASREVDDMPVAPSANVADRYGGGTRNTYRPPQQRQEYKQVAPRPSYSNNSGGGGAPFPTAGNGGNGEDRPICQLCGKVGHIASRCFKRFKRDFAGMGNEGRVAAAAQ